MRLVYTTALSLKNQPAGRNAALMNAGAGPDRACDFARLFGRLWLAPLLVQRPLRTSRPTSEA